MTPHQTQNQDLILDHMLFSHDPLKSSSFTILYKIPNVENYIVQLVEPRFPTDEIDGLVGKL